MDLNWILVVQLPATCLSKKNLTSSSNTPKIPIDLSLTISKSCHTLSKALDISKNTSQNSRVGYALKAVYVL